MRRLSSVLKKTTASTYIFIRYGEIALIALAWAGLLRIRKNNAGGKIQGPVGKVLRYIEGEGTDRPNTDS